MAKRLSDAPRRNSFAEGAARFAEIARNVKAQQVAEQQTVSPAAVPVSADAPDEEWARKFSSRAIGPSGSDVLTAMAPVRHALDFGPDLASLRAARSREFSQQKNMKADLGLPLRPGMETAPMSARFGKEQPRRSWLGRLFRRA